MEEEKSSNLTLNICIWPIISVLSSEENVSLSENLESYEGGSIQCTPFSLVHTVEILLK